MAVHLGRGEDLQRPPQSLTPGAAAGLEDVPMDGELEMSGVSCKTSLKQVIPDRETLENGHSGRSSTREKLDEQSHLELHSTDHSSHCVPPSMTPPSHSPTNLRPSHSPSSIDRLLAAYDSPPPSPPLPPSPPSRPLRRKRYFDLDAAPSEEEEEGGECGVKRSRVPVRDDVLLCLAISEDIDSDSSPAEVAKELARCLHEVWYCSVHS